MTQRYRVSNPAIRDLEEIWEYVAAEDALAADRFVAKLLDGCEMLGSFPFAGRSRGELQDGLRSLPVGRHVIFYEVLPGIIEIKRILHGGRDLHAIFVASSL